MIERSTLSPKCWVSCAETSLPRLLRTSYMVRSRPSISSRGLSRWRTALTVSSRLDNPSSAKYSHCTGISTPSAAVSALRVSRRSEEHTSELQSLMRISYAVFCLKKKHKETEHHEQTNIR